MKPKHDIYDFVIIGSGVAGALCAYKLSRRQPKPSILLIEAGDEPELHDQGKLTGTPDQNNDLVAAKNRDLRKGLVESYALSRARGPLSPYEGFESDRHAPSPEGSQKAQLERYYEFKQAEGDAEFFKATYQRIFGGSTNSWRGNCPRLVPNDFLLKTKYNQGEDWPITYNDLEKWYTEAEHELGVSGDHDEWNAHNHGAYRTSHFPMPGIVHSYSDERVMAKLADAAVLAKLKSVPPFDKVDLFVLGTPQARTSQPYSNDGAQELRPACEGNGNCIPVCPIKAKYDASVHLLQARKGGVEILPHSVVSTLEVDPSGSIEKVNYLDWRTDDRKTQSVRARHVILATHGIENAKILLYSGLGNSSGQVGRNLMDHLNSDAVGIFPEPLYTFRGPQGTASIPAFCDGPHRKDLAAFNITFGNDGWGRQESPDRTLSDLLDSKIIGKKLRDSFRDRVWGQLRFSYSSEQLPRSYNRVLLGQKNDLGIPRPLIQYKLDDYSRKAFAFAQGALKHLLRSMGCVEKDIRPASPFMDFNTAGHIMGTTRMGSDPKTSVVDAFGRSHDHPNLHIVGSSVFTTSATANPTITIAALALRTIDSIH